MYIEQFSQLEQAIQRLITDNQGLQQALSQSQSEVQHLQAQLTQRQDELETLQLAQLEHEEQQLVAQQKLTDLLALFPTTR